MRRRQGLEGAGYVFVFESVLERLVFDEWVSEDPGLPLLYLQELIREGGESSWPQVFWNAFGHVFEYLLDQGRFDDWLSLVNDRSPMALRSVAAQALVRCAASSGLPSDTRDEELLNAPAGRVIQAFERTGEAWVVFDFGVAAYNA